MFLLPQQCSGGGLRCSRSNSVLRVAAIVAEWLATEGIATPSLPQLVAAAQAHLERRIAVGVPSRSPSDFARWIHATVEGYLNGEGDDGAPARLGGRLSADDAFGLAAAPRGERAAVIMAALARLTPDDRRILRARLPQGATWLHVAATLGVSVATARAWHAAALARAQAAAVEVLREVLQDETARQARDRAA